MKSKTSFIKISPSIIREDFRRYWAIPVLAFLGYFLSGLVYLIANYDVLDSDWNGKIWLHTLLNGSYPPFLLNMMWVSILSVILIFRYLHQPGSVMAVHSQPFTRQELLASHTVSGLLFSILPLLATAAILLLMSKPVYFDSTQASWYGNEGADNLFGYARILQWLWYSILICCTVSLIAILGGMVTGTSLHHTIAALGFNVVLQVVSLLFIYFISTFLFGFGRFTEYTSWIARLHPLTSMMIRTRQSVWVFSLTWVVAGILLYALSAYLYQIRKLERATEGVVFRIVDVLITMIFGFLGMTMLGLIFRSLIGPSMLVTTLGYLIGGLLAMVICRMIIMKTIHIFTPYSLKIIGTYFLIAVAFLLVLGADLTHYETRIPANAKSVTLQIGEGNDSFFFFSPGQDYQSEDAIQAVEALHREITNQKGFCIRDTEVSDRRYDRTEVRISYYSRPDGKRPSVRRTYTVPTYLLMESSSLQDLIRTAEFQEKRNEQIPENGKVVGVTLDRTMPYTDGPNLPESELDSFMDCLRQDVGNFSAESFTGLLRQTDLVRVQITYCDDEKYIRLVHGVRHVMDEEITGLHFVSIGLNASCVSTMQWIRDHGYTQLLDVEEQFGFATVQKLTPSDDGGYREVEELYQAEADGESQDLSEVPESSEKRAVTEDPQIIADLFHHSLALECLTPSDYGNGPSEEQYLVRFYVREEEPGSEWPWYNEFNGVVRADALPEGLGSIG